LNFDAHGYQVESVAFDIDFKTKVTRAQFENACKDLHSRFARPIYDALANAELQLVPIPVDYVANII